MRKLLIAAAMLSVASMPVAASAQDADFLSVERVSASVGDESNLNGSSGPVIFGLVALAALIAGVIIAADDDDSPVSP